MTGKNKLSGCLKKIGLAVLALVVVFIAFGIVMTNKMTSDSLYVTGSVVNVRSGPGTEYEVVGQLKRGDFIQSQSDSLGWLLVSPLESTGITESVWVYAELTGSNDEVERARAEDRKRARAVASKPAKQSRSVNTSGTTRIAGDHWFGCSNKDQFKRISRYAAQGDEAAFSQGLAQAILGGTGYLFSRGEEVFIADTSLMSGLVKVRPKGQMAEYWTNIEAID
jgi:uncharacterized protein YraI